MDKCRLVHINANSKTTNNCLYLNSDGKQHLLSVSDAERDLGILVDSKLNYRRHILEIAKKANRMLGLIKRNFRHFDTDSFLKLYKTLVRSQLEYAQSVWQPYKKKDINHLETIQRRATKILPHLSQLPYSERLRQLKLPSLVYRRKRGDMIETFKILHSHYDNNSAPYLTASTVTFTRSHNYKLFKSHCNTNTRKFSFCNRIVDDWNALPLDTVNCNSINSFKNHLDKFWFNWLYITSTTNPTCSWEMI